MTSLQALLKLGKILTVGLKTMNQNDDMLKLMWNLYTAGQHSSLIYFLKNFDWLTRLFVEMSIL